ncbi:ABC transporter ATP-binding protein [Halopiger djelfimassiliensis]|uniref:ABC transporter ATP-binding protein n=1 Tax=Halopiger djelfimassiliensis TaxID=1293047 RepID=UPI0006781229|nr:sn-glycerol-3-phosphate ABC transporter ATP-binding protein UgpC [Halopiger djelfimassiliensis]
MGRIDIDALTKEYSSPSGPIRAVERLDLEIDDGEFIVLVGPSGCGKSTTLRCIAGLETVTSGSIRFDGTDVTDEKPKDRDIAMVFQNYALYPHMTARENMAFGLKMSTELSADEIESRVEEVAEMMDITELLGDRPGELSGGQQQRVALGRAIVRDPDVFLMDEPLSNLDAKLRAQMRTELQQLQNELGVTTIYVTHDQTEAMTMGDRIVILNDGQLQQVGTPLECYHRPANRFVAGFIGSPPMNFLEVKADPEEGTLVNPAFTMPLSESLAGDLDSTDLVLGIRPEHVSLTDAPGTHSEPERLIETEVTVTEPMGDVTNVYLEVGDETITGTVDGHVGAAPGERLHMHVPASKMHLFDADSGRSVKHSDEPIDAGTLADADSQVETV